MADLIFFLGISTPLVGSYLTKMRNISDFGAFYLSLSPFFAVHIWVVPHPFFEICVRIRPCVLKAYTLSSTMRPLFVYRVMRNLTSSAHQAFNTNVTLDIDFQQPLFCQTTHFQCTLIVYDVGRTIQ